jgi:predicted histidine transporter YuiF (NhaC family)
LSKTVAVTLIGLLITPGTGSSFGTVPVVAAVYVPLRIKPGFSIPAAAILAGAADASGGAGSPASDSTAGLNADGQHNHFPDTRAPAFAHYNIPLIILGTIGAMFF